MEEIRLWSWDDNHDWTRKDLSQLIAMILDEQGKRAIKKIHESGSETIEIVDDI